jgi:AsmA protein
MLEVKDASVIVDVLSLLSMQPEIDQLILDGLTLRLQKNRNGQTNWDDLVQVDDSADNSAPEQQEAEPKQGQSSGIELAGYFGGLDIRNVNVKWQDDSQGESYDLLIETLATGRIAEGKAFPLQLVMSVNSKDQLAATLNLQASALLEQQHIKLTSLLLTSTASGSLIPFQQVDLKLAADIDFSLARQMVGISGFSTTVQSTGGVLSSSKTTLSGEISFDLEKQWLKIAALDLQSDIAGDSVPNQQMKVAFSSRQLEMILPARSINLQNIAIALNENNFTGFIKVADYARPDVSFELASKQFDVDKLLGKSADAEQQKPVEQETTKDIEIKLPMEMLRQLKLDGKLSIASLVVQGLHLNDVSVKLVADNGIVALKPISVNLYDGSLVGEVEVNAQGKQPVYRVSQQLSSFHIGEFLQDFMQDDMLSGNADVDIKLKTQGEWLSQLKANLNGDIGVKVLDGALKGFNLRQKIKVAQAKLKREKKPEIRPEVTDFSSLMLSAKITDGVLTTDDLDMQAPLIRVGGKGSVNLLEETVNYLVNAKLVATTKGQQGGSADELTGLTIPVLIKGSWLSPDFDVQLDEIFKAKLDAKKAQIRDSVARQKAQVQQQLAEQKQKLKAAQQKEMEAKKQQLKKQQQLAAAEEKARLQAAEDKKRAELAEKKKQQEEEAKKKLKDKLKKLF